MKPSETPVPLSARLRQRPVLALVVLLAVVVPLLAWWLWPKPQDAATAFYEVQRGDFTVTVLDRGTLTAVSEVSIRNEVEGTARVIYIVPEGTFVKKGDLLVELDSSQAQDQYNLQLINYEKAQFALVQAEAQLKIQESAVESDIRAAKLKVRFAELDLKKFLEGQQVVEEIESANKVLQALAQLKVNEESYRWSTELAAKGFETKQKVEQDRLTVMNNTNSLIVASNTLWMLRQFDLPKQREKFESDYQEAIEDLKRVEAQSQRKIDQYKADLQSQANTLELNKRKLDRDRKNLDATKIVAKQDGLVVYAMSENRFSSESLIEEGAVVRNRQELIKLPDTSTMKVTIKVHESHVGLVQIGQPAFVKLDSMPDQRFAGVVDKVALLPDSQARFGNPNLKVYNTEVVVIDPLPGVKPGVSAQAEIIITNISNSLSVPLQAVTSLKGRQVVYAQHGNKTVPVPVQVGMFNTKFIQITSGLKEGDRVLLSPPFDTQEKDLEGAIVAADERAKAATNRPVRPSTTRSPGRNGDTNMLGTQADSPVRTASDAPGSRSPMGSPRPDLVAGALPGMAEPGDPSAARMSMASRPPGEGGAPGGRPAFNPEEMLKQYDKDGDGQLDETEREAMRVAMQARFGRGGGPGGARMSREEMLKRFDKNEDGELDEEERTAMRESMGSRGDRGQRGGRGEGRQPGQEPSAAPAAPTSAL